MSPTLFYFKHYRFFFFSREETRKHVHVSSSDGEAKFWLEPSIELAKNYNLDQKELREVEFFVRNKKDEIIEAWEKHFRN